ncbi:MAG: GNAT family N-acetyltransferase [Chloroflexota bacterium]|nr:GNAT family N-acetyltransferase [Chloroflexota bacterium]
MASGERGNDEDTAEEGTLVLADGAIVPFRPICPDDAAALQAFHAGLSVQSVYFRFFGFVLELTAERARYFTDLDGTNRFALVALDPTEPETIIAVVRYDREAGTDRSEYAAIITDRWQGRGLGLALTQRLIAAARRRGVHHLYALVLSENNRMLHLLRDLHLPEHAALKDGSVRVELDPPSTDGDCAESLPDLL